MLCSVTAFHTKESGEHPHPEVALQLDIPVAFHFNTTEAQETIL